MKRKIFLSLFLMLLLGNLYPQGVNLSGTATYLTTGQPVADQEVIIQSDSSGGSFYYNTVTTNSNGFYQDFVPVNTSIPGLLSVSTMNCNGSLLTQSLAYGPNNFTLTADFQLCQDSISPDCQSAFYYVHDSTGTGVQFTDISLGNPIAWLWDFGDGSTSSQQHPYHFYPQTGMYTVTLTISTSTGCTSVSTLLVSVGFGAGCQANFTWFLLDTIGPNTPVSIQFTDLSTGNPQYWSWNFGDGSISTQQNPIHTYSQPGTYTVCLTIQSIDSSCYDEICLPVWIGNPTNCAAFYTYYPLDSNNFNQPSTIQFVDQSAGQPVTWFWSFGDGTSSTEQNPVHTYAIGGLYDVCLTIQGADSSCFDTFCQQVYAGGSSPDCQAMFYHYPIDSLGMSGEIQFVDQSLGNPMTWLWNFGDGNTSTMQNPLHTYNQPGMYNVCLTIENPATNCFDSLCIMIWVNTSGGDCINAFSATPNGMVVLFDGYLLSGEPAQYVWDLGDGNFANGNPVTHTYAGLGSYTVSLTTTTTTGCTHTSQQTIYLNDTLNYQTIQGTVTAGNMIPDDGIVLLIPENGIWTWGALETPIDQAGHFIFTNVAPGNYHLLAIPYSVNGDTMAYLPTYYGDVIFWEQATLVTLGTALSGYNIQLVPCNGIISGQGMITGSITSTGLKAAMSNVNILLLDEENQALAFNLSNSEGGFGFGDMAFGIYTIWAEMHGVTTVPVTVTLSENNPAQTVNLKLSGNSVTGFQERPEAIFSLGNVFPNPLSSSAGIKCITLRPTRITLSIISATGQIVSSETTSMNGTQTIELNTANLPAGFYFLNISAENGYSVQTKFMKVKQ